MTFLLTGNNDFGLQGRETPGVLEGDSEILGSRRALISALRYLDLPFVAAMILLTVLGLWVLFGTVQGSPWLMAAADRQVTWFGLSLCGLAVALLIDYRWLGRIAPAVYILNLALLVAVLIAGTSINGSMRWFRIGPISFQPAETMKVVTVMMLAQWFALRPEGVRRWRDLAMPGLLVGAPMLLILRQPDLGTAILFLVAFVAIVFWAGIRLRIMAGLGAMAMLLAAASWPLLRTYQKQRILNFLDPTRDTTDTGYNLIQSLIAVGNGGISGTGWGQGTQSVYRYLPEAHTDFIFASAVEQLGLLGGLLILALFGVVFWRILVAVHRARDRFGGLMVIGLGALLMGHVFVNIGMTMGLAPVVGLPLPFLSYGGTYLLATYGVCGLILNVSMRRFVFGNR